MKVVSDHKGALTFYPETIADLGSLESIYAWVNERGISAGFGRRAESGDLLHVVLYNRIYTDSVVSDLPRKPRKPKLFECDTCGWTCESNRDRSHSCTSFLAEQVTMLRELLAEANQIPTPMEDAFRQRQRKVADSFPGAFSPDAD